MLLITGRARPAEGARDRLISAARTISEATGADEGCIYYAFTASLDDDAIVSTEVWEHREALEAHLVHDHTLQFLSSIEGALDGDPIMSETELQHLSTYRTN